MWAVRRPDGVRLAVKVLRDEAGTHRPEASWSAAVDHDHVLPVWDTVIGRWNGRDVTCLVMPLAEGGSLQDVLTARGHLTAGEIVTVLVPLAQALHHLHTLGLVHGDLKPANVLLTADGRPLLSDLGAARLPVDEGDCEVWATDRWSAPEVLHGELADAASDAYGLGAIAWACATGEPPPPAALRPLLRDEATHLPPAICDTITACLSHTASARPSPTQFAELIWASAQAEPAPVALSPGARTARTVPDPGDELTRRLRAQARASVLTQPAPEPAKRRWRRGPGQPPAQRVVTGSRRQARAAAATGAQYRPGWWRERRVWVAAGMTAGTALVGGVLLGTHGSGSAAVETRRSAAASSGLASAPPASSAVPAPTGSATGRATADGAITDPVAVLQPLLTARAAAWNNTDSGALGAAFAADSVAWQRDQGDLKTVANRSAHYSGLGFRVQQAQVTSQMPSRAIVRAQVVRTAATMTVGAVRRPVPEQISTVDFTLVRTQAGWRIDSWRST